MLKSLHNFCSFITSLTSSNWMLFLQKMIASNKMAFHHKRPSWKCSTYLRVQRNKKKFELNIYFLTFVSINNIDEVPSTITVKLSKVCSYISLSFILFFFCSIFFESSSPKYLNSQRSHKKSCKVKSFELFFCIWFYLSLKLIFTSFRRCFEKNMKKFREKHVNYRYHPKNFPYATELQWLLNLLSSHLKLLCGNSSGEHSF